MRRGWYLGSREFKKPQLEALEGQVGQHHFGALRMETAQAKAERIITEELGRLGWQQAELASRRKHDPAKLEIAARLRRETTLSVKQIATRRSPLACSWELPRVQASAYSRPRGRSRVVTQRSAALEYERNRPTWRLDPFTFSNQRGAP